MTDLQEWLVNYAEQNAVRGIPFFGPREAPYFGYRSPGEWIDSLSNVELLRYFNKMNDGENESES